ncbi:UNVERIFIED_CONTAM: hypothetical protein FKN15_002201 [Acipenser sinensis]
MNLDSLSLALSQISYLVDNLTKKNYRASQQEIQHIVNRHGPEADRHLLRCLFSHVDFSGDGKSSGKDFHQTQFLIQECVSLITKPNFISTLSYAIDNPLHYQKSLKPSPHLFTQLSKVLKLSKVQEVVFGLALLNSSSSDLKGFAAQFVKQKLPDLLRSYVDADVGGNQEDFPQERCPVVLAPLLYPEKRDFLMDRILPDSGGLAKTMMESSLADFMQEVGYGFCASLEECRNIIVQYGVREVTASQVARVLGMMARTHSGLSDGIPLQSISAPGSGIWSDGKDKTDGSQAHTWNVEVLIDVVKELNPNLNFKEVTYELDHHGFIIRDSKALQIVVYGIQRGLGMEVFPVDLIYRPWKHAEGQLSFVQHSLMNPDIFCFADYPCHTVATDILKAPPEDDNREIATWSVSQELSETILTMVANCSNVMNKARQPPPGVMPKGRAPSTSSLDAISPVQIDPLSGMASLNISGSAASHTQSMQGFPTNLSSAFSNPQSPAKAFPALTNPSQTTPFSGIGGLSSQLPGSLGSSSLTSMGSGLGIPTVNSDPFGQRKMSTSGLNPPTFQQSKIMPSDLSQVWPEANQHFSKEIDDEANSYFQRIYNHPPHPTMSVDEVLEMLQRFKDSNIKREREVFNCMLRNLFEEYRFFPQYPDKELHITACLFGGIIEKGLVTYMALGLALRYVLEALRKPFGSKMYYFGIAALDRFKNRLKDYPQYCQHLASITHFLQFPHHLQEYIEYGQQSRDPPVKMQGSITTPGSLALAQAQAQVQVPPKAPLPGQVSTIVTTSTTTTVAKTTTITRPTGVSFKKDVPPSINTTNIDTLLVATDQTERIVEPPENVQEKIAFIFNNLSQSNMTQKVEELKETVKEEFMPWVSQYLVMKRVSIEPNFHSLYSNFLDTLKNQDFIKMVLSETYRNIKAVEGLLDATSGADADLLLRYRECHLLVLKALQDGRAYGSQWCNKQITRCLIECRDEYKYNVEAVELLIRNHLVNMQQYDLHLAQMHQQGILKTDDLITRFFRLCTEMCVEISYRAQAEQQHNPAASAAIIRAKCYHNLDAFVRLIALLVKHSGEATNTVTKINLLNKVLGIVVGVLIQDHDVRQTEFQQLPYHRIFIMLLLELNAPEHVLETINFQTLTAFCNTFHILRPTKAPGFVYAWLELISHRIFIARMLAHTPQQKGWPMYAQLLIDLFKYLGPFLRNVELNKPMQILYKGTLRVLLVLLHDFPEFLCDYHYGFCDVIPPNCIQLRNLILSAFPRNMRLPDPFTPNLKVSNEAGNRYNIQLINALVLYVGTQAIAHIHNKGSTPSMSTITHSAHMDIFQNLAVDLDTEGRYLFLNAIANQLRYPNSHTHYFSCTMLYLFAEANTEAIQEQITRVLLERLIVNRPHPWGLLITFIELIKNPAFKFWNHDFVHCAPEIEKLFQSVAQCCMGQKQAQQVMEGTSAS